MKCLSVRLSFRPVHVRARSEKDFCGFHDCLRQGGVRMDTKRDILRQSTHLNRKHPFGNQFARPNPHDTYSKNALTLWIHNELGHSVRSVESYSSAGSAPGKSG